MQPKPDKPRADLPHSLPDEARELYRASYDLIRDREIRAGRMDERKIAETAHEGAWLAVQTQFERDEQGNWRRAPIGDDMDQGPTDDGAARSSAR